MKKSSGSSDPVIRVLGLPGSVREGSLTALAVRKALEGARLEGAVTELVDLRELKLPFACDHKTEYGAAVDELRKAVTGADGIILGTPEYHGGMSGVLKNALDLMGFDEFRGKMIGLVGVSGGALGAHDALNSLRTVGRALHAWVVPTQAAVPAAWKVFGSDGSIRDAELASRLEEVGREVARFARLHKCAENFQFVQEWEEAPENPGGLTGGIQN